MKALLLSTNVDQQQPETEFSIGICRLTGDKWESKTQLPSFFDPRSSIVKSVFDCRPSAVLKTNYHLKLKLLLIRRADVTAAIMLQMRKITNYEIMIKKKLFFSVSP